VSVHGHLCVARAKAATWLIYLAEQPTGDSTVPRPSLWGLQGLEG
jgi:hypothetical protein